MPVQGAAFELIALVQNYGVYVEVSLFAFSCCRHVPAVTFSSVVQVFDRGLR